MTKPRPIPKIYQLKISLNGVKPEIWRRFQMRGDNSLVRLHNIIQNVMGWEDCHLHAFDVGSASYTHPDAIEHDEYDLGYLDASKMNIAEAFQNIGDGCRYRYDFGDNWEHTIVLERILEPTPGERYPLCIDGARSCPPEDCGGDSGYGELLEVLANSQHEDYEDMKEWVGPYFDPEKFDLDMINSILIRRVVVKANVQR